MPQTSPSTHSVFTETSAFSLAAFAAVVVIAFIAGRVLLPKSGPWNKQDRFTFIWLTLDALTHFTFEFSFIVLSTAGHTVNTSTGIFAQMWQDYAKADRRWGTADPTIVAMELVTVFGTGTLAVWILYQIMRRDSARYYWIVVLSTAELYGGWMTFGPEWVAGSPNLDISNPLYLWVYLFLMNVIWVVAPLWLLYDSYIHIVDSLRSGQAKLQKAE
ncbi:Emopamil-binding protein [Lactifluus volemus]|nr:Emopamil-binding protein [Lactifluus volemus]